MSTLPRPWVEAYAPATVSNLGPGFDCLGLAVHGPGDTVRARRRELPGAVLVDIRGDQGRLPREPEQNTACVALNAMLERLGLRELGFNYVVLDLEGFRSGRQNEILREQRLLPTVQGESP